MSTFKRSVSTSGKLKSIVTNGETFIDDETGEELNLAEIFYKVYGSSPFELSSSQKENVELD